MNLFPPRHWELPLIAFLACAAAAGTQPPVPPAPTPAPVSPAPIPADSATARAAQLLPAKLYTGIHEPLFVIVQPADAAAPPPYRIALLEPVSAKQLAIADVPPQATPSAPSRIDLASAFPAQLKLPKTYYAQLLAGEKKVGPALVLQPLVQPLRAVLDRRNPARPSVVFPPEPPGTARAFSGFRTYVDKLVTIQTERGSMTFHLRPDCAPNTAWTFRHLAEGGFFDGTDFFRTVPVGTAAGKGFVVQGGDPTLTEPYDGGPGFDLALEPSPLPHDYGVLSMARDTEPDTAGSQFFICLSREETARLDGQYAAFGQMIWPATPAQPPASPSQSPAPAPSPVEVLTAIANSPLLPAKKDRPAKPVKILSMKLVDAAPYGDGNKVVILDGNKPGVR